MKQFEESSGCLDKREHQPKETELLLAPLQILTLLLLAICYTGQRPPSALHSDKAFCGQPFP